MCIVSNTSGPKLEPHSSVSVGGAMRLSLYLLARACHNSDFETVFLDSLVFLDIPIAHAFLAALSTPWNAHVHL